MTTRLLLLLALVIATVADDDFYTCIPGIDPSPGVSTPKGDIEVLEGSDPFSLYCHLNPGHHYYNRENYRSSDLGFWIDQTRLPSTIVNSTTIMAMFDPSEAGETKVTCKVDAGSAKKGICKQIVYVGWMPKPVENFTCVSQNWLSMNCTWDVPYNPVKTSYQLVYKEPGRFTPFRHCPNNTEIERLLDVKLPKNLPSCYTDLSTHPPYRQPTKKFTYYFNATNPLQPIPTRPINKFVIDHYSVVRPGIAQNLAMASSSPTSLILDYDIPNSMHHFPPGLLQAVRYKNEHDQDPSWVHVDTSQLDMDQEHFTIRLTDLPYPWTRYTADVKMLSGAAEKEKGVLWSDPASVTAMTLPAPPYRPPDTHPASFEIVGGLDSRNIFVYWKKLENRERNGPGFSYQIARVDEAGSEVPILPDVMAQAYAEFHSLSLQHYTFYVTAKNDEGPANTNSRVLVENADKLRDIQPKAFTKIDKEESKVDRDGRNLREFEVAWRPPTNVERVVSYTVFWCRDEDKRDRPYQCDGDLDWVDLEPVPGQKTQNYTLHLPAENWYQMAVAANTDSYSSGMVWATCTIRAGKVVSKLKDVSILLVTNNKMVVSWRLDCSDRVGIVTGYRVEYCALDHLHSHNCTRGSTRVLEVGPEEDSQEISGLEPWTYYKTGVRVITRGGPGDLSDPITNKTKAAAPGSVPANLNITKIESDSASLSWSPPMKANGDIGHYEVRYSFIDGDGENVTQTVTVNDTHVDLTGLYSYTSYTVMVRGCTECAQCGCSRVWAETPLVTRIGHPGRMKQPTVVFNNATMVSISWNKRFQLGAPKVEKWIVRVARDGREWANSPPYIDEIQEDVLNVTINLEKVAKSQNWSPDCGNKSNTNMFNFSTRAVVVDNGQVYKGEWSEDKRVPAYCAKSLPWLLIILASVLLPIVAVAATIAICRLGNWYQRKKAFFDKLGRELDTQLVVTGGGPQMGGHGGYNNAGGKDEEKKYKRSDAIDSMETLLMGPANIDKSHHVSGGSDTTSGCDSGSSEMGGSDRRRTESEQTSSSEGERRGSGEGDRLTVGEESPHCSSSTLGDEALHYVTSGLPNSVEKRVSDPTLPPFTEMTSFPDPTLPPTHPLYKATPLYKPPTLPLYKPGCGPTPGYISMEMTDDKTPEHYTRFTPTSDTKLSGPSQEESVPPVGYSRVGSLLDPAGLSDLRQRVKGPPVRGVMVGENQPGAGYVAFNSIKNSPPQVKTQTPGYITIDQINWT